VGRPPITLDAEEIVGAALHIFNEKGLDAVSMRTVSARLGVSPVPVYRRIGNKEALLDAMANRLLADVAPLPAARENWRHYAFRWVTALRTRLGSTDVKLLIGERRAPYVEASRPLVEKLQASGFGPDAAVQACRLLIWATVGFVIVETRRGNRPSRRGGRRAPGGDPAGVSPAETDRLFELHLRFLLDGLERARLTVSRSR
jgi:TetR/AcrR family tetracycline transcriptional repressor